MNDTDKTMLALASLTYRGFAKHSEAEIENALTPWLPKLKDEGLGTWDLAWGPASFRTPTSLFDDAMMYVVKERTASARYVIAIRGTNPISLFDWVFGDFWVSLQIDWDSPHESAVKLSGSTALGMVIIRHIAAERPATGPTRLESLGNAIANALQKLAKHLPELDPKAVLGRPEAFSSAERMEEIAVKTHGDKRLRSEALDKLLKQFGGQFTQSQRAVEQRVFDGLLENVEKAKDKGEKLIDFLKTIDSNAVVAVTGHSKGGALCAATALWLEENWAASRNARIECFSFAGPTPGNAAFAERYNNRLAGRTHRIVNPRDVVPQAFVPEKLEGLNRFYPKLGPAISIVVESVAQLGYTHVSGEVTEIESQSVSSNLVQDLIYQHLDAYLKFAAFKDPDWNAQSIFTRE